MSFGKMHFSPGVLESKRLPVIDYPIPIEAFQRAIQSGGDIEVEDLLFWIMQYLDEADEDAIDYERVLLQICEDHLPQDDRSAVRVRTAEPAPRSLWCAEIDVTAPLVGFERKGRLMAVAQAANEPGRMKVCAFGGPSGELCQSILAYALETYMYEDFNSFEQLLYRAKFGTGNAYASLQDRLHMVPWGHGLGWTTPDEFDESYRSKLHLNPIPAATLARLLRVWAEMDRAATC